MTRIYLIEFCGCVFVYLYIIVNFCNAMNDLENKLKAVLPELYDMYLNAVLEDKNTVSRRFNKDRSRYNIHIKKLKQVNGVKTHNIAVEEVLRSNETLIYINNPVESQIPNAFLTQSQFKEEIMNKARQQQMEFKALRSPLKNFKFKPMKKNKTVNKVVTPAPTKRKTKTTVVTQAIVHKDLSNEAISEKSASEEDDDSSSSSEETEKTDASTTISEDTTVSYSTTTYSTNFPINKSSSYEDDESSTSSEVTKITDSSTINSEDSTVSYANSTNAPINKDDKTISDTTTISIEPNDADDTTISLTENAMQFHLQIPRTEDATVIYTPTTITTIVPTNIVENHPITEASSTVTVVKTTEHSTKRTRRTRGRPYVFMGDMKN